MKKGLYSVFLVVGIICLGGFGGIFFDRYALPRLASFPGFSNIGFLRETNEHTTIINKTEQVVIREDDTVERIVSQPATAVVNIVVLKDPSVGNKSGLLLPAPQGVESKTGALLTNDGLAVTYGDESFDNPVLRYRILLFDGSSHEALFVGRDPFTNLAFFRVNDQVNTPAIAFANSDDARVGRKVIAIGNAFAEYQNRLAVGILENRNRTYSLSGKTVASTEKLEGVLEIDVDSPNRFSGGPVIGYNGEMIGLMGNQTLDNASYSFLIPSNVVREAMNRLIAGTLGDRPVFGAYYLSITKAYALAQGLSRDRGALIYSPSGRTGLSVIADSPAARVGLQFGDIVTAVDGQEINLDHPFSDVLSDHNRGDRLELTLLRGGKEMTLSVQL